MYRPWLPLLLGCLLSHTAGAKAEADPLLALEVLESYSWESMDLQCEPTESGASELVSLELKKFSTVVLQDGAGRRELPVECLAAKNLDAKCRWRDWMINHELQLSPRLMQAKSSANETIAIEFPATLHKSLAEQTRLHCKGLFTTAH